MLGPIFQLAAAYPLLSLVQMGFTIWMLMDCRRRGSDSTWFWIILVIQPIGAWIYFFAVKARDFRGFSASTGGSLFQRRVALDELQYQADKVPTLANHLALAERLIEKQRHTEAIPHLEAALALEPDHCQVLYGLAVSLEAQGRPEKAIPYLEKIVQRDRRWSDYSAWRLLATCRAACGDRRGALADAHELVRLSPRLQHQCVLAERLVAEGLNDEAWTTLEQALESHRYAPGPSRRLNRAWAREAQRLQKRIASR